MIPDNLIYTYSGSNSIDEVYEINDHHQLHGLYVSWYNGRRQTLSATSYYNGKRHGMYLMWFDNGVISEESFWNHGELHGLCRQWKINGILHSVKYYYHDIDISNKIKNLVSDIANITNQEKTQISIAIGIIL